MLGLAVGRGGGVVRGTGGRGRGGGGLVVAGGGDTEGDTGAGTEIVAGGTYGGWSARNSTAAFSRTAAPTSSSRVTTGTAPSAAAR